MSVTSISSTNAADTDATSTFAERRKNMQALDTALQGGDLQAAQSAFAAIQQSLPAQNASSVDPSSRAGQFTSGLQAVGQALQSGDVAGAQKAFAALQQTGAAHGHHHHHRRAGGGNAQTQQAGATPGTSASDTSSANTFLGTLLNKVG